MSFQKNTIVLGAVLGGLAVGLGAFGAHALKGILLEHGRTETYELAVRYQFYHTLAILLLASLSDKLNQTLAEWARLSFLLGILIFSGSLYILSTSGVTFWGAITPIGGVAFIAGWILFALSATRK